MTFGEFTLKSQEPLNCRRIFLLLIASGALALGGEVTWADTKEKPAAARCDTNQQTHRVHHQ
jgi:3-deoxy-D-arabino-heptulosonate 7-phosphate (DAHP) synthase